MIFNIYRAQTINPNKLLIKPSDRTFTVPCTLYLEYNGAGNASSRPSEYCPLFNSRTRRFLNRIKVLCKICVNRVLLPVFIIQQIACLVRKQTIAVMFTGDKVKKLLQSYYRKDPPCPGPGRYNPSVRVFIILSIFRDFH